MIDKIMFLEKIVKEIKRFVEHCLSFQSKDAKEWIFGVLSWNRKVKKQVEEIVQGGWLYYIKKVWSSVLNSNL